MVSKVATEYVRLPDPRLDYVYTLGASKRSILLESYRPVAVVHDARPNIVVAGLRSPPVEYNLKSNTLPLSSKVDFTG